MPPGYEVITLPTVNVTATRLRSPWQVVVAAGLMLVLLTVAVKP